MTRRPYHCERWVIEAACSRGLNCSTGGNQRYIK
jgi:hypothetical protein